MKQALQAICGLTLAVLSCVLAQHISQAQEPVPKAAPAKAETGSYSAVAYTLDVKLDPAAHSMAGSGVIRWTNKSAKPQVELWLHLYLNAFKNERTVFQRSTAGFGFRGGKKEDAGWGWITVDKLFARELNADLWKSAELTPGDPEDETDARVRLPRPVKPGETITLDVAWTSQLPRVSHRTGYADSFHMVAQWFPKLAVLEPNGEWAHFPFHRLSEFYADYGDYDVTIETPAAFLVGASGEMVEEKSAGDRVKRRFRIANVHDFAFTAWDGFSEAQAEGPDGIKMRCLFPKGEGSLAQIELDDTAFGLEYFGKHFGKYPYKNITIVHPPDNARDAGGMEYPTLFTTGGSWTAPLLVFAPSRR